METDERRRRWLVAPMAVGGILAGYMLYLSVQSGIGV